nr:di-N-acetylchitobiase-like isoform X2 [Procambarus clarkii]
MASLHQICVMILGTFSCVSGGLHSFTAGNTDQDYSPLHKSRDTSLPCLCSNPLLCMPLGKAVQRHPLAPHVQEFLRKSQEKEVFAFVLDCDPSVWGKFNWSKLSTIALAGFYDLDLLCHAHEHGVKVVRLGNIPTSDLPNATARHNWVKLQVSDAALNFLDGINIDFEDVINPDSPEQEGLTNLVQETAEMFHTALPGSQVSFDVAWSANGIDGRYYDYKSIANYSDLIFIMAYDEQSQIFDGPCTARPNSGIYKTAQGIQTYLDLDIPAEKMVLGVPWYGYNYPCISLDQNDTCFIEEIPFRGANCSDAAGTQYPYSYMVATLEEFNATYHWEESSLTPWYNIKDKNGQARQMRYDDGQSLLYKYMLAIMTGMRGVGMWTANFLDYSETDEAIAQQELMWSLLL